MEIILASSSPRRRDLLEKVGWHLTICAADIDESTLSEEDPIAYVKRIAAEKAHVVAQRTGETGKPIVAADTTVAVDSEILAKPVDAADTKRMLRLLSNRSHLVHTAVTVLLADFAETIVVTTEVDFIALDDATIEWYIATGEPHDKAGAYALQGIGAAFVRGVRGSVTNVVGLPLAETMELVRKAQVSAGRYAKRSLCWVPCRSMIEQWHQ